MAHLLGLHYWSNKFSLRPEIFQYRSDWNCWSQIQASDQSTSWTLCILMDFPIHIDAITMGLPIEHFKGSLVEISICPWRLFLNWQTVLTLMKCSIMLHFIWVFIVCKSIRLGVSRIQRANLEILTCGPLICTMIRERSGSVVECLTRDRRATGSSLTGVTALWSLGKIHLS